MELDDRARREADALRRRVVGAVDTDAARAELGDARARLDRSRRTARLAAASFAALVIGGFALAMAGNDSDEGSDEDAVRTPTTLEETTTTEAPASPLEILPAGPVDGRDSYRLPVIAEPRSGLSDGQTVHIYGRGFEPDEQIGIVHCTDDAETAFIDACDLSTGQYFQTTPDGDVDVDIVVQQRIVTPGSGEVDCAATAERCLIGVGAMEDYDRSGGTYISFAGAPPFDDPTMVVEPSLDLTAGQAVDVRAASLARLRQLTIQQCAGDVCDDLANVRSDEHGAVDAQVTVSPELTDGTECSGSCVIRLVGLSTPGSTSMPLPDDHPIGFTVGTVAPGPDDGPAPADPVEPAEPVEPEPGDLEEPTPTTEPPPQSPEIPEDPTGTPATTSTIPSGRAGTPY